MKQVISWVDKRFPLTSFIKHELTEYPTPRNLSFWWNFGSLAGIVLVIQLVTGIFLAMHYKPDVALAFDSVLLWIVSSPARTNVVEWAGLVVAADGCSIYGLLVTLGANVLLGRTGHHQPVRCYAILWRRNCYLVTR